MSDTVEILKGEDATFQVKLRFPNGDPYSLEDTKKVQVSLPKKQTGTGYHTIDDSIQPVAAANGLFQGVTYTAVTAGSAGNAITLIFDGVKTIAQVVSNYNSANPTNQVTHNATNSSVVPTAGAMKLDQGQDAFQKVQILAPAVLRKMLVILTNADTNQLKVGKKLPIYITVDNALTHPAGTRRKVKIDGAVNVTDGPV